MDAGLSPSEQLMNNLFKMTKSLSREQDPEAVLQRATDQLRVLGFKKESGSGTRASFSSPGMNSTRQDPLRGAREIRIDCRKSSIKLEADLGGLGKLRNLLIWLPAGLGSFFLLSLLGVGVIVGKYSGIPYGASFASGWHWVGFSLLIGLAPVFPWVILSPMMIYKMKWKSEAGLKKFLLSLAAGR